jgi:DNA-binding transcriptional ArsR family regulator
MIVLQNRAEPSSPDQLTLEAAKIKKAVLTFRAINHRVRQQILQLLHKKGSLTVTEVYVKLKLDQPVASAQLAILKKANLVISRRDGRFIHYSVNYSRLKHLHTIAKKLLQQ